MILMVYLNAIQLVIAVQRCQHTWRKQVLATSTPRMRNHRQPTRLVHEVDSAFHVDGVARYMSWSSVGQEAVERLLTIVHMPSLDQRVGDVWTTNRGTVAHLSHHLGLANRNAQCGQLRQDARQPAEPALADFCH